LPLEKVTIPYIGNRRPSLLEDLKETPFVGCPPNFQPSKLNVVSSTLIARFLTASVRK